MFRWLKKSESAATSRVGGRAFGRVTGRPEHARARRVALRVGGVLLTLAAVAGLLAWACRLYFVQSGLFSLRHIEIQTGDTLRPELVRGYLKLEEGAPLFDPLLARRRDDFLNHVPTARELTIVRRLPDRVTVRIVERSPLARIARRPLAVDAEGMVFVRYAGIDLLPVIGGMSAPGVDSGMRVTGLLRAAVVLLETLHIEELPLAVVEIDVAHEDYIACTMSDQRHVKIAWEGMTTDSEDARAQLRVQLLILAEAMNTDRGRARARWDATVAGRAFAL